MLPKHYTYSFEKLEVWQLAREMRKDIYMLTTSFPKTEQFNLTSQLRRAVGSVTANLAEGSGRAADSDKSRFTNYAYASALEVVDHLIAAFDLRFVDEEQYNSSRLKLDHLINKLNGYYKYQIGRNSHLKDKLLG